MEQQVGAKACEQTELDHIRPFGILCIPAKRLFQFGKFVVFQSRGSSCIGLLSSAAMMQTGRRLGATIHDNTFIVPNAINKVFRIRITSASLSGGRVLLFFVIRTMIGQKWTPRFIHFHDGMRVCACIGFFWGGGGFPNPHTQSKPMFVFDAKLGSNVNLDSNVGRRMQFLIIYYLPKNEFSLSHIPWECRNCISSKI